MRAGGDGSRGAGIGLIYKGKALICEVQVSAFCYAAGAWIRDIWYRSVLQYDAFGYGNESCF